MTQGPVVKISDPYRSMLHKRWDNTLIVMLWGRNIGYRTLCNRLPNLWRLKESVRVVDLANNFYFVKFQTLTDGPWIVMGHYLTVEPWRPQFNPSTHKVTSIVAWIQIPDLSCEYYDRCLLQVVCNEIGRLEALRGRYARVALEIDLSKPLQSQILVDDKWYLISYENIPDICFECGLVLIPKAAHPEGHSPAPVVSRQPRGEWMIAGRKRRPPRTGDGHQNKETNTNKGSINALNFGSRFD
ncbi:hypothetical protein Tsubulata_033683, partial [Turnera subulata]